MSYAERFVMAQRARTPYIYKYAQQESGRDTHRKHLPMPDEARRRHMAIGYDRAL